MGSPPQVWMAVSGGSTDKRACKTETLLFVYLSLLSLMNLSTLLLWHSFDDISTIFFRLLEQIENTSHSGVLQFFSSRERCCLEHQASLYWWMIVVAFGILEQDSIITWRQTTILLKDNAFLSLWPSHWTLDNGPKYYYMTELVTISWMLSIPPSHRV